MVAIDCGKRIMGIIGSLSNLTCASLLQNRECGYHFGERVGAVSVRRQRQCSWFVAWQSQGVPPAGGESLLTVAFSYKTARSTMRRAAREA